MWGRLLALACVSACALLGATAAGAAPPRLELVTAPISIQQQLTFPCLQGGHGEIVMSLQGTLNMIVYDARVAAIYGGKGTATGTSGATYEIRAALGLATPFGGTLRVTLRQVTPSLEQAKLLGMAKAALDLADQHLAEAAKLEADAQQDRERADELEREAAEHRAAAQRLIDDASALEKEAASLEAPATNPVGMDVPVRMADGKVFTGTARPTGC